MSADFTIKGRKWSGKATRTPRRAVIGYEAEFNVFADAARQRPEVLFGSPQRIVRKRMIPRAGRSFHMPSGGAVYFDTGVIEVATPIIEIEEACCLRAARSLWEQIGFLRQELDAWERRTGVRVRLQGFSEHFNISVPLERGLTEAGLRQAALLLTYMLPVPVMLLGANRLSTGVGVRLRGNRIEVTVDFTPDPDLMAAAAALATGMVLSVLRWRSHGLGELCKRRVPVIAGFRPRRHTSRKGWLARADCFPCNPFASDPGAIEWLLTDGRSVSLRQMAREIAKPFRQQIRALTDAGGFEHLFAVFGGRARSLMDFPERPPRYDDVGQPSDCDRRSERKLPRSAYEQVIRHLLEHRRIRVDGTTYSPERMLGWYEISFREVKTGRRRVFNLDELVASARKSVRFAAALGHCNAKGGCERVRGLC